MAERIASDPTVCDRAVNNSEPPSPPPLPPAFVMFVVWPRERAPRPLSSSSLREPASRGDQSSASTINFTVSTKVLRCASSQRVQSNGTAPLVKREGAPTSEAKGSGVVLNSRDRLSWLVCGLGSELASGSEAMLACVAGEGAQELPGVGAASVSPTPPPAPPPAFTSSLRGEGGRTTLRGLPASNDKESPGLGPGSPGGSPRWIPDSPVLRRAFSASGFE
mmetsp:Transcript_35578/g.83610  ORF Transcript_35578/g.83610 Transcript_35578/m.83610 type:complete len:221 (-) Transcript_35578:491-1153(-)